MDIQHTLLPVENIEFDKSNPRIADLLDAYDPPSPEIVYLALRPGDQKYAELKQAIKTNKGIIHAIIVHSIDGRYVAIEGNTRLAIYKELCEQEPENERWKHIPCIVRERMDQSDIDAVRLQAHLVGVRNWTPFAKARYLFRLSQEQHMPLNQLVDYCGGNMLEVQRNIDAYRQMIDIYRPILEEQGRELNTRKFSTFLEAQSDPIRRALVQNNFTERDFATWVAEGKFEPRQELVRILPDVLNDQRAREVFFDRGAAAAEKYLDNPSLAKELANASLVTLCSAIQNKIKDIRIYERDEIRGNQDAIETVRSAKIDLDLFYENELSNAVK